jgi:hypothetical protein
LELLLGCGASRTKKLHMGRDQWSRLVTLDINGDHKPDVVHDIASLPLPFEPDTFDEIHAYEVMEHVGQQGDWRFYFDQWADLWRILKPGGHFFGTSPAITSRWAWGDPGHTRVLSAETITYLHQPTYDKQIGTTAMTDYRFCYRADFEPIHLSEDGGSFVYILQAVKPSRCAKS